MICLTVMPNSRAMSNMCSPACAVYSCPTYTYVSNGRNGSRRAPGAWWRPDGYGSRGVSQRSVCACLSVLARVRWVLCLSMPEYASMDAHNIHRHRDLRRTCDEYR